MSFLNLLVTIKFWAITPVNIFPGIDCQGGRDWGSLLRSDVMWTVVTIVIWEVGLLEPASQPNKHLVARKARGREKVELD